MPVATSIFLTLSLALAVVLGPQMRAWSWGPSLLVLAAASACAAWVFIREKRASAEPATLIVGSLAAAWFAWRAWTSPVAELAHADLLLLAATVGGFLSFRTIAANAAARSIFFWGLAMLILSSAALVFLQHHDASWSQFRVRPAPYPSGFFGHYNEGANFLVGGAFLLLGSALFGGNKRATAIIWLAIALAAIVAVYFTRSRGGILAAAGGIGAFGVIALVVGSRRQARWFTPALIAFPILALAATFGAFTIWQQTHEIRFGENEDISGMMDANTRLRNYSLAVESILRHTWLGGGSRSFSWDSLLVWDPQQHGYVHTIPEQVHNEILQAATDYGLIGATAVLGLLGWLAIRGLWLAKFDESKSSANDFTADACRVGGLAALAAMLVQSNFSFVFHLLPGTLMLGIAMAALAIPRGGHSSRNTPVTLASASFAASIAALLLWPAATGTRIHAVMAGVYLKTGAAPDLDEQAHLLARAIAIQPDSELHSARAAIHHASASDLKLPPADDRFAMAINDYLAAAEHNPKHPGHVVNAANLLSLRGEDARAEALYAQGVILQGKTESVFLAHFHRSDHFRRKGAQLLASGEAAASLASFEQAAAEIAAAAEKSGQLTTEGHLMRGLVHASLGAARDAAGDIEGADQAYRNALKPPYHEHTRYWIGDSLMRRGYTQWHSRKPEAAFSTLSEARALLAQSHTHLPAGITETTLREKLSTIDETLALLRTAGYGR